MKKEITDFKRIELKFLITKEDKDFLISSLDKKILPDNNWTDERWNYQLENIYYDTKFYKFLNEKEEEKYNKKIRIRRYIQENFTENDKVYLEIKEKNNNLTVKRRVKLKYIEARNLLDNSISPTFIKEKDKKIIEEILSFIKEDKLFPKIITTYERQAFFWTWNDNNLRISFDNNVKFKWKYKNNLTFNSWKTDWYIIPKWKILMEIKVDNDIPLFLKEILNKKNILPERISKYNLAVKKNNNFKN